MLFDGIQLVEGSEVVNLVVDTGTILPTSNLDDGELFFIKNNSGGQQPGLYVYSMATTTWARLSQGSDTLTNSQVLSALGYTPVNKAGDTMTGSLYLSADPTSSTQAATKNYVDAAIAGLSWKNEAACATTGNITLSGEQTIDGVLTSGSRVLVKNQTFTSQNGIYVSSSGTWTRSTDTAVGAELVGAAIYVDGGTVNANSAWVNTNSSITYGTTSITFSQFGGGATYSAGAGLALTGNVFSNTGVTSLTAGTNISLSGSSGNVTISSTSASAGSLTGTALASNVTSSSLTSVGTLGGLTVSGTIHGTTDGNITLAGGVLTGALIPYSANVTLVGTSTQLSADINYIETISGGASPIVLLPAIALGREVTIINNTTSTINALAGSQSQLRGTNCYVPAGSSITLVGSGHFTTGDPSFPFWMATTSPIQAGAGITVSQPNEYNTQFATTITNSGVTSLIAGSGISLSNSTGIVTITSTGGGITSVTGTAHQIDASTVSGAVTLSLPASLSGLTSVSATTFTGALTGHASLDLPLTGGTLAGALILNADPATGLGAATKNYVDAAIAGLSWKNEVACATTINVTLFGEQTIDGVTTSASRVLVKNQATASANGIYLSSSGAWTRTTDMTTSAQILGSAVYVDAGTTQASNAFVNTNTSAITVDTTAITFVQFSGGATYTAGTGLSLVGNTFNNIGVTSIIAGTGITISGSSGAVTVNASTSTIAQQVILSMPGAVAAVSGTARWYPPRAITLIDITAWCGTSGSLSQTATVLINNTTTVGSSTIAANQNSGTTTVVSNTMAVTDYLTVNVSATTCSDLSFRVRYQ